MRRLLTEFYDWMYRITGIKLFSYLSGLVYLTAMNYIIAGGITLLMQGLFAFASLFMRFFLFPFYAVTIVVFFGLTYWLTPPVQTVAKDAKKNNSYRTLLLYTALGVVLFLYKHFADKLFV